MMNSTKKINVNFSSLVGLKAELLKKQHEVNEAKLKSEVIHTVPKLQKKKNKKLREKCNDENIKKSECTEDVDTHKKSKLMLEAKAKLYERLKKSKCTNDNFLVDFTNKSDESEEEPLEENEIDENDPPLASEDDWVEYEDCFGRTRKCLREDLFLMQEKDELIRQQIINTKGIDPKTKNNVEESYIEEKKEPEIEIMRRKWEEQTIKLADKVNIHYQDVLFDEARAHGVSYYAFSQDEEERIKQQENLFKLRKETERKQSEIKELKELRDKMEHNRLKAAKIRQRIRAGLPIDTIEETFKSKPVEEYNQNVSITIPSVGDEVMVSPSGVQEEEKIINLNKSNIETDIELEKKNKIRALGELLGKRTYWYEMSQEEWVSKCRKIRDKEFGPVYENFKSIGSTNIEHANTTASCVQNNDKMISSKMDIQKYTKGSNKMDADSYDIPLPPKLPVSDSDIEQNNLSEGCNVTKVSEIVQHTIDNTLKTEVKLNRNIDEASIAAGLKYLREKFEESQNT